MYRVLIGLLIIIVSLESCRQNKEIVYLQGLDSLQTHTNSSMSQNNYKVQISDILYVKIISDNQTINNLFNNSIMGGDNVSRYDQTTLYFQGYTVNYEGIISLPVLGDINVKDKTVKTIEEEIKVAALEHIKNVSVVVKLGSFKVTMLGEVGSPGMYYFFQEKTTLFEAIAMCGDLTEYGNRKNILILRPTETGTISMRIDITDENILDSDLYFLKPNDLIYVEPVKSKGIRMFASDYGTLITIFTATATTVVLILTLFV